MQRYGWSPISIDLLLINDDDESSSPIFPPTRQDILNIFQNENLLQQAKDTYEYRSAESGGTEQAVEPKESLEVKLSSIDVMAASKPTTKQTEGSSVNSNNIHQVDLWCLGLSKIAHLVCNTQLTRQQQ